MKRILFPLVGLLMMAGVSEGAWWTDNITLWAPFDNVSAPLQLDVGTGSLTFTRATTATYTAIDNGFISTAASGELRIESAGALFEGERTNLCLQSAALGTTWSPTNITVGDDNAVSPDGTTNAELLTASAGNGTIIQDLGVIAEAAKVFSIYLKRANETGNIDLTLNGGTGWTTVAVTPSWARYSITATLADPDVGIRIVTDNDAVWAWGGQVEAAAFASSYIPTTTVAVTRNADALSFAKSGNLIDSEGTLALVFDTVPARSLVPAWTNIVSTSGGDYLMAVISEDIPFYGSNAYTYYIQSPGGFTDADVEIKAAIKWAGSNSTAAANGGLGAESGYVGTWAGDTINVGPHFGHIRDLRIWNRSFADNELQSISGDMDASAFTFTDVTGAAISTVYTSDAVTVVGITSLTDISISGGTYSINGGDYTSDAGVVSLNDNVSVRVTSSGSFSDPTSTTLTIGEVSDTYTVTTRYGIPGRFPESPMFPSFPSWR